MDREGQDFNPKPHTHILDRLGYQTKITTTKMELEERDRDLAQKVASEILYDKGYDREGYIHGL